MKIQVRSFKEAKLRSAAVKPGRTAIKIVAACARIDWARGFFSY
jgi:hypothetical protein